MTKAKNDVRLNDATRTKILVNLIRYRFQEAYDALFERERVLAILAYETVFTKTEIDKMALLPDGWLPETSNMRMCTENGYYIKVHFGGASVENMFNVSEITRFLSFFGFTHLLTPSSADNKWLKRRIPCNLFANSHVLTTEQFEPFKKFQDDCSAFAKDVQSAIQITRATLAKFSSVEKLLEAWPDVESFLPKEPENAANLPAIPVGDLNKMLGLPPDTDKLNEAAKTGDMSEALNAA